MEQIILDELMEIFIDTGFYKEATFHKYGHDSDIQIDAFIEDFFIRKGITQIQTDITDAFDSPGYECSVLSVSWVDDDGLHLETWLLEVC